MSERRTAAEWRDAIKEWQGILLCGELATPEPHCDTCNKILDAWESEVNVLKTGLFPEAYGENVALRERAEKAEYDRARLVVKLDELVDKRLEEREA
jgi:hypothetical protein